MRGETREIAVLTAVIEQYIHTGKPVASAAVAGNSHLRLSSASIRAVMAVLTDQGYLEQPHTSAGRVPTAKAFRVYVDAVLTPKPLPRAKTDALIKALDLGDADISQILRRASAVVANHSMQLGVVLAPRRDEMRWRMIEFSSVSPNLVLAVLVLDGGSVRTRMVNVPTAYTADELVRCSNYLNTHFKGCTLSEVRLRIAAELELAGEKLEEMSRNALTLTQPALEISDEEREFFMDGFGQVSHTSAFADTGRLRELLAFMGERPRILELLERTMTSPDISVSFIQGDHDATPWAVVSAPYAPSEDTAPLGVISAIGLVHMNYAAVLPVVNAVAASVAGVMRNRL